MDNRKRILQANLNNSGGAFSVAYEAQKELQNQYIFDYFFPDDFIKNDVYTHLLSMGSKCVGKTCSKNRLIKQYDVYKNFYNYLQENDYDIVHIHSDTAWKSSIYYLAAKKAGIKRIIVHSHSSGINGHYKIVNLILHLLSKQIVKSSKFKCACSKRAAEWMFGSADNVYIIRNGVDINKYKFNPILRNSIRNMFGIQDKFVIGTVGDFSYPKNPEFIYDIVNSFKNNNKYTFLFVGNKPNGCVLKDLIDSDQSINNVIFTGVVTNVPDYLSAMDCFILPSRFEGLPMCAIEAQVNGLYTIVSDHVTEDTNCSKYFNVLALEQSKWENQIIHIANKSFDRTKMEFFLDTNKASSSNMAMEFKRIYEE